MTQTRIDPEWSNDPLYFDRGEPHWLRLVKKVGREHFDGLFSPTEMGQMAFRMSKEWNLPVLEHEGHVPEEIYEPRYWVRFWEPNHG